MNHVDQLIDAVSQETKWTHEETRNFLRCMRADSPDGLLDACAAAVAWAMKVETQEAMVSLMKTFPAGAIQAEWTGTDIALRINPDATVTTGADGVLNIDWPEAQP